MDDPKPVKKYYQGCLVPMCRNTNVRTPDKLFFSVPKGDRIRRKWCSVMHRTKKNLSANSSVFCCEDHFSLEMDTENMMRHKLQGVHLRLKPGVLPHRFDCQRKSKPPRFTEVKRKRILDALLSEESVSPSTSAVPEFLPAPMSRIKDEPISEEDTAEVPEKQDKGWRKRILDSLLFEESASPSTSAVPSELLLPAPIKHEPILEEHTAEVPGKRDIGFQTNIKIKIRSKGTSTPKRPVVDRATSPIRPYTRDVGVSPVKFKPQPAPVLLEEIYSSDSEDATSCSEYEPSDPSYEPSD